MIKKLRLKFILVSMLAITIVMVMLIGVINIMNYRSVVNSADRILAMLTDGGGRFPGIGRTDNDSGNRTRRPSRNEEDFIQVERDPHLSDIALLTHAVSALRRYP